MLYIYIYICISYIYILLHYLYIYIYIYIYIYVYIYIYIYIYIVSIYIYIYTIFYIKKWSKTFFPYGLRVWPLRMASTAGPDTIEKQRHVWPLRMTTVYGFPYGPRMAIYLKNFSVFLRMTFTYDSHVVAKPLGKTTLRMTSAYDFFTYGFAHDSAHDPRMATKKNLFR